MPTLAANNSDSYLQNTRGGSKGFEKPKKDGYTINRKHPTLTELFKANKGSKSSKLEDVSNDLAKISKTHLTLFTQ